MCLFSLWCSQSAKIREVIGCTPLTVMQAENCTWQWLRKQIKKRWLSDFCTCLCTWGLHCKVLWWAGFFLATPFYYDTHSQQKGTQHTQWHGRKAGHHSHWRSHSQFMGNVNLTQEINTGINQHNTQTTWLQSHTLLHTKGEHNCTVTDWAKQQLIAQGKACWEPPFRHPQHAAVLLFKAENHSAKTIHFSFVFLEYDWKGNPKRHWLVGI